MFDSERNKNVVIAGGTGFIGSALTRVLLLMGYRPIILTRGKSSKNGVPFISYSDPQSVAAISASFAVINLAGQNIASSFWTKAFRKKIMQSRIETAQWLTNTIRDCANKPDVFIQASATGFYGNGGDALLTESSAQGEGFLAGVCREWEKPATELPANEIRSVVARFGIVLSSEAGFLKNNLLSFRYFLGGYFGNGKQWIPWIHINDLVRAILFLMEQKDARGFYNLVSPRAVTARRFAKEMAKITNKPVCLRFPAKISTFIFGQLAREVLLSGQKVFPEKLLNEGFKFHFNEINNALQNLIVVKPT